MLPLDSANVSWTISSHVSGAIEHGFDVFIEVSRTNTSADFDAIEFRKVV